MNTNTPAMPGGWRLRDHPVAIAIAGLALAALSAIAYFVPDIFFKISVSDARGVCNSGLGLLAQGMDQQAQSVCSTANTWAAVLEIAGIVGVILAVVGGFLALQRNQRQPQPQAQPQRPPYPPAQYRPAQYRPAEPQSSSGGRTEAVPPMQPYQPTAPGQNDVPPPTRPLQAFMEARQTGEQDYRGR